MRSVALAAIGAAVMVTGCVNDNGPRSGWGGGYGGYDYNRPDPAYGASYRPETLPISYARKP